MINYRPEGRKKKQVRPLNRLLEVGHRNRLTGGPAPCFLDDNDDDDVKFWAGAAGPDRLCGQALHQAPI